MSEPKKRKIINKNLRVPYALAVHRKEEENAVLNVLKNYKTQGGNNIRQFESNVSVLFGKKHGVMVNSGSSMNLLTVELIKDIAKENNLIFVEDSCDTSYGKYCGMPTGIYSDISTTSFYGFRIGCDK